MTKRLVAGYTAEFGKRVLELRIDGGEQTRQKVCETLISLLTGKPAAEVNYVIRCIPRRERAD